MKIKDYLIAVGTAAVCSVLVTVVITLMSLISWAVVWVFGVIIALPISYKIAQEYRESREKDYILFLSDKIEEAFKDKTKNSSIDW